MFFENVERHLMKNRPKDWFEYAPYEAKLFFNTNFCHGNFDIE